MYSLLQSGRTLWRGRFAIFYLYALCGVTFLWLGTAGSPAAAQEHDPQAQTRLEAAWDKVKNSQTYRFRTSVEQKTYPVPSILNAGRQPVTSRFGIEGAFELDSREIQSTLWPRGTFDPAQGVDMKVENGRSYVRPANTAGWEEIGGLTDSFAPGGDPFGVLSGMTNVQATGTETTEIGGLSFTFETYSFDINGPAFARYIQRLNDQTLAERGDLPNGISSATPEAFRDMTGTGELWLDTAGYPARITLDLAFSPNNEGERITAYVRSDFYDYVASPDAGLPALIDNPYSWLQSHAQAVSQPETASAIGWSILLIVVGVMLAVLVIRTAHTKQFHATLASLIIAGMVVPPLVYARDVHAYYEREVARSHEQAAEELQVEQQTAIREAQYANDWNPQLNPYAQGEALAEAYELVAQETAENTTLLATANTSTTSTTELDSDGDGVNDMEEIYWDSCPYLTTSSEYTAEEDCSGVADPSDSDGDGLTDYAEILQLGTYPDLADSDGDFITDTLEVEGFDYNGITWYLDPMERDTNNDGRSDMAECPVWNPESDDFDASAICPDTDGDGEPDLFDVDDDNDGLWDIDDYDPISEAVGFGRDNPLNLSLSGLQTDKPVVVDVTFRPADSEQLTYSNLVLDWPEGDYEGQITRGLTTTFATTNDSDAYSTDATASYGDVRIIPVMRITMPYTDGHYANLPVNDTYHGVDRTLGVTNTEWLDDTELSSYGINVSDVDATSGDLVVYVPVSTVYGEMADSAVAFNAKMIYQPSQGTNGIADWGNDHQYDLLWMVQMITDSCVADVDEDGDGDTENESGADCTREDDLEVIHIYRDDWELVSLQVTEEHGLDATVLFEDPAEDDNLNLDDQLWLYGWNMVNGFVEGVDCDALDANGDCVGNDQRDIRLDNLDSYLTTWGNGNNYVSMTAVTTYPHQDYLYHVAYTTTNEILDGFNSYVNSLSYVSTLTAYETTSRSRSLQHDSDSSGNRVLLDFTGESTYMTAAAFMSTYQYDAVAGDWEQAEEALYFDYLTNYLQGYDDFFAAADDSDEAAADVAGKMILVQSFYAMMTRGVSSVVEIDASTIYEVYFASEEESDGFFEYYNLTIDVAGSTSAKRLATALYYGLYSYIWGKKNSSILGYRDLIGLIYDSKTPNRLLRQTDNMLGVKHSLRTQRFTKWVDKFTVGQTRKKTISASAAGGRSYKTQISLKGFSYSLRLFALGAAVIGSAVIADQLGADGVAVAWLTFIGIVFVSLSMISFALLESISLARKALLMYKVGKLDKVRGATLIKQADNFKGKYTKLYRSHALYGILIGLAVSFGVFFWTLSQVGNNPLLVKLAFVYLVASVAVELIFFALALFVPIGTLIVTILEAIDAILLILEYCDNLLEGTGADGENVVLDAICSIETNFSIQGAITDAIADVLYDFDLYAANLDDDDRIDMDIKYDMIDSALGYSVDNGMIMTMTITNTVKSDPAVLFFEPDENTDYSNYASYGKLKQLSFEHDLTFDRNALANVELEKGEHPDAWSTGYEVVTDTWTAVTSYVYISETFTLTIPFNMAQTGINSKLPKTFFNEAYNVQGEGCWIFDIDCEEFEFADSFSSKIDPLTFDILPATLTEFVLLDWNNSNVLAFPNQYDQDGDGLLNQYFNGTDLNDKDSDSDDDGLDDYYEQVYSTNGVLLDSDNDGLSDYEENIFFYTDPYNPDIDDDGLNDGLEVKQGWLIPYTDASGTTQVTRIWSSPYHDDYDDDGIKDAQEYLYNFHPNLDSDLSVIDDYVQFTGLSLEQSDAARLLLKLDDGFGATILNDESKDLNHFICNTATCPEMETTGKYGFAPEFDGVDDLIANTDLNWDAPQFTIAAWVYVTGDDGRDQPVFGSSSGNTADSPPTIIVKDTGASNLTVDIGFGDGTSWQSHSPNSNWVTPNTWQHVAATFDGERFRTFINGNNVWSPNAGTFAELTPATITEWQIGANGSDFFEGKIDEVIFFDRALSDEEVADVKNGLYDVNDYYAQPGAEYLYNATISNTAPVADVHGFLSAETGFVDPIIGTPELYIGFDSDQRIASFDNTFNTTSDITCHDDGDSCPTNSDGTNTIMGTSLLFDGVDNLAYLPSLTSNSTDSDQSGIFFYLYINSLPVTDTQVVIIDTISTADGAADILLDQAGNVTLEAEGYPAVTLVSGASTGTWIHLGYQAGNVYRNGNQRDYDASWVTQPQFGPAYLGNSGDQTKGFDGYIDELVIYHELVTENDISSDLMDGRYELDDESVVPHALFRFEDLIELNTTLYPDTSEYANHAICEDSSTCPSNAIGWDGNNAVEFDGVDDYLVVTGTNPIFDEYYVYDNGISFYIYPTSYPAEGERAYIYDTNSTGADGTQLDIYLDSDGKIRTRSFSVHTSKKSVPLNEWTLIEIDTYYEAAAGDGGHPWQHGQYYFDGEFSLMDSNAIRATWCTRCDRSEENGLYAASGRIGNSLDGGDPFEGYIDDVQFSIAKIDFEPYERTVSYVDPVHEIERVECDLVFECPEQYGQVALFGGSDRLDVTERLDFADGDYTIGFWFRDPHALAQTYVAAYDSSDLGVSVEMNGSGQIEFGHHLPLGSSGTVIVSPNSYNESAWHYATAVKEDDTMSLYIDGEFVASVAGVTGTATDSLSVALGYDPTTDSNYLDTFMDELIILEQAVSGDEVALLMDSTFPLINLPEPFITFDLAPNESTRLVGVAEISENAANSSHYLNNEVEVALDLETDLSYTTYENRDGVWSAYFRFEEVPGDTAFNNLVGYGSGTPGDQVDGVCYGEHCPVGGVRGIDNRAAYFDGVDDYLNVDFGENLGTNDIPTAASLSVWVKGSEGTILDTRGIDLDEGFELTLGSWINDGGARTRFDTPLNEWVHIAASINTISETAEIYINGSLVISDVFQAVATADVWTIGANYGAQNHFHGYIDELQVWETELTSAEVANLYQNTGPDLRFEFDEEAGETLFVDRINGYLGNPVSIDCVDVRFDTLSGSNIESLLNNIWFELDGTVFGYDNASDYDGNTININLSSTFCNADQTLTMHGVYSDSSEITLTGSETLSVSNTGVATATFTYNGQTFVLTYEIGEVFNETSPIVGTDGRIGNTAYFTGEDNGHIEVDTAGLGDFANDDFTFMGWIKTEETNVGILTKGDGDTSWSSNESAFYVGDDGLLEFHNKGDGRIFSSQPITDGNWHHFAFVWDSSAVTGTILVDGIAVTDYDAGNLYNPTGSDNATDQLWIGTPNHSEATDYFAGQLDELVLYTGRAYSAIEVFDTFQQEARWYRDGAQYEINIDQTSPTITMATTYPYRVDGYIQLVMNATDEGSGISLVEWRYKKDSSGYSDWATAPICSDSVFSYCPAITSSGEGVYQFDFRLVDKVGNETEGDDFYIYVDTTSPNVSGTNDHNNDLDTTFSQDEDGVWTASFGGTFNDPDIVSNGVVVGSGVNTSTLFVNIYDETGAVVGSANQTAVTSDSNWSIDYVMTDLDPAGKYTVTVTLSDLLGNVRTDTVSGNDGFTVDLQEPVVALARDLLPSLTLSQTDIITGIIVDQTEWHNPVLALHFEEAAGATEFYDYGQYGVHPTCDSNCAQTTAAGFFGRGLAFNGTDQSQLVIDSAVISDAVNFDDADNFTIGFWVQASTPQTVTTHSTNSLVEKGNGNGAYPFAIRYHNSTSVDAGRVEVSMSDGIHTVLLTSTNTIHDGQFHHVGVVKSGDLVSLFIDGQLDQSADYTLTGETASGQALTIGHVPSDSSYNFSGVIDELFIYDYALTDTNLHAVAHSGADGLGHVQVALEEIDWAEYPEFDINERQGEVSWGNATLDQADSLGSAWTYDMGRLENFYYIHLLGKDDADNETTGETHWHGLIDHKPPVITASGTQAGGGQFATTTYDFTITDFILQADTLVHPCGAADLDVLTYTNVSTQAPHYGHAYQITGSCTVAGHVLSATVSIYDGANHFSSETITFASADGESYIEIIEPINSQTISSTAPVSITGDVYVASVPLTIEIEVDNALIDTLVYTDAISGTSWSTVWEITDARTHVIDALVTDDNGNTYSDSVVVDVAGTCSVDYDGDDVTDFSGDSSAIRDALAAVASGGTIRVAGICEGTSSIGQSIFLAYLDKPVTIAGGYDASDWTAGADPANTPTILDVSENGRIFYVADGTNITIKDMVLANGRGEDASAASWDEIYHGGAIYMETGTDFTLDNVTVFNGTAREKGGGFYMNSGSVTIRDSAFVDNEAGTAGGAIHISGTLTLEDSLIDNASGSEGGGVYVDNGTFVMSDSTIDDSSAAQGGGIYVNDGDITISGSTVSNNEAIFVHGGGIHMNSGTFNVTNSTLSGNTADDNGGGFYNNSGTGTLSHVSVVNNDAGAAGGGLYNESGTLRVQHSIIAYASAGNDCSGTITDQGGNIASDASCGFTQSSSLNSTDPLLDGLADNGGETETHNVQAGSPAIDQATGSGTTVDQRGVARPQLSAADSGAVEYAATYGGDCDPSPWDAGSTTELNQAIACYNSQIGGSAMINLTQDITLIDDTITISNTTGAILYIDGQGYSLSGGVNYRVLQVENGAVDISDLTLRDGSPQNGTNENGGALLISTTSTVTIRSSVLINNDVGNTWSGGAIANYGSLAVSETLFQDNYGYGNVDGNSGGAHIANFGDLSLDKSLIIGGETIDGGGVFNGSAAVARITNSTFINVLAYQYGGVIYNSGGTAELVHVTASQNTSYSGGDIANLSGAMTMTLSALSSSGGGQHCLGTISDGGGNIADDASCSFTATTSNNSQSPGISTTLADNGGETETLAITSGSSAAVDVAACVLSEDQRDVARPNGVLCDSGAVEFEYNSTTVTPTLTYDTAGDLTIDWASDGTNCAADIYRNTDPYDGHLLWQEDLMSWSITNGTAGDETSYYFVWLVCDGDEAAVSEEVGVFHFELQTD